MKLIVGLGNPDATYQHTRHNFGALFAETLARSHDASFSASTAQHARVARITMDDMPVLLAIPTTYMNDSGRAVAALVRYYKVGPEDLTIVYDDLDLPLGTIRISRNQTSGGHRGIESILQHLGGNDFNRIRLGIGEQTEAAEHYVLKRWTAEQEQMLPDVLARAQDAAKVLVIQGLEAAAAHYNRKAD